jgi:hypothetical protein
VSTPQTAPTAVEEKDAAKEGLKTTEYVGYALGWEVVWKRLLPLEHFQGPGSSPALYKNLLILVRDGGDQQYITALDTRTGQTVWKSDRPPLTTSVRMFRKSFSTPLVFEAAKPQLWAVRVHGQGDVTATNVAWKLPSSIGFMASPLLLGRELYLLSDDGFVTCVDAASGEILNKVRAGGNYAASPTCAEGRIYCFSREGKTLVFAVRSPKTMRPDVQNRRLDGSTDDEI